MSLRLLPDRPSRAAPTAPRGAHAHAHASRDEGPFRPDDPRQTPQQHRVAYLVSRFPKLTETFVTYEIEAVRRQGIDVRVFPLLRARNGRTTPEGATLAGKLLELLRRPDRSAVMHAEAAAIAAEAQFTPLISWTILAAQAYFLLRRPAAYVAALATVVRANLGSPLFLLAGLAYFPKAAYLARRLKAEGVRHVHAHFANHPAAVAWVVHRLSGIPYSFTAHGADLHVDQHMLREKVADARWVAAISQYNKAFIEQACGTPGADKVAVIRCGVDPDVFRTARRARRGGPWRIVCIGTLYEVKGHRHLIDACQRLAARGIDFDCQLVGEGPLRDRLQAQVAAAGLADRVRFEGRRTRQQIVDILAAADVLVAPSVLTPCGRREGIPCVLMEALAAGLPVVASRLSGIPELVEDGVTGLLVPPGDDEALAAALARLLCDPVLAQRLAEAGHDRVLREFSLHRNAAELARRFREGRP